MASYQIDQTAPYTAANGHRMVAPIHGSDREGSKPFTIWSYAYCVDNCPACGAGGTLEDYAGEEWDPDDGAYDWAW